MFKEERDESLFEWSMLGDIEKGRPNLAASGTARLAGPRCVGPEPPLVEDLDVRQPPGLAEPSARTPFRDPVFGRCVTRLTDRTADLAVGDTSQGFKNEYSRVQSFNADESLILIRGTEATWYLYRADTLQPLGPIALQGSVDPRWDASRPQLPLLCGRRETHHHAGHHGRARGPARLRPGPPRDARGNGLDAIRGEPLVGREHLGPHGPGRPIAHAGLPRLRSEDRQGGGRAATCGGWRGRTTWTASPSARWATTSWPSSPTARAERWGPTPIPAASWSTTGTCRTGAGSCGTSATRTLPWTRTGARSWSTSSSTPTTSPWWTWPRGEHRPLAHRLQPHAPGIPLLGARGGSSPAGYSCRTHDEDAQSHTWMDDELFAMELKPNGRVVRLAHTHSIVNQGGGQDYFAEPQATVNRDFTKALFTTNWGRTGTQQVETYLVELESGWDGSCRVECAATVPATAQVGTETPFEASANPHGLPERRGIRMGLRRRVTPRHGCSGDARLRRHGRLRVVAHCHGGPADLR